MDSVKRHVSHLPFAEKSREIGLGVLISVLSACGGGSSSFTPPAAQNPGNPAEQTSNPGILEIIDSDSDGIRDSEDAFPFDNRESVDTDADGTGDNADTDDDNDGVLDREDAFPTNTDESIDTDGDNQGDNSDPDIDNDGVENAIDDFPYDAQFHRLQDAMQGTWTTGCIQGPLSDLGAINQLHYVDSIEYVTTTIFNDTSCSDYPRKISDATIMLVRSVEYGSNVETTDGRTAILYDLELLEIISNTTVYPEQLSRNFTSIEDGILYGGIVDADNPGVYELRDHQPYTRTDTSIAAELIGASNPPIVVNPIVTRASGPTITPVTENRTPPAPGSVFNSDSTTLKSNGADLFYDPGPQRVDTNRVASWPGLRYGNFLVSNNAWNASAAHYPDWYQEISLFEYDNSYAVTFNWDWGSALDTNSPFDTKSFPEVIYGTKSAAERSGSFAETGLPIEIDGVPEITIDYQYDYEVRQTESSNTTDIDIGSEFNVAIESFFHDSCDIVRTGSFEDNQVFEMMVWLKAGNRKPSGDAPQAVVTTSDGRSFDVYTRASYHPAYIAFVAQAEMEVGTVQYSELIRHTQDFAVEYGIYPLKDTDCLANIIMGTEIWHGAGTFNLKKFQVNRRY